jgi:hypothetical protein
MPRHVEKRPMRASHAPTARLIDAEARRRTPDEIPRPPEVGPNAGRTVAVKIVSRDHVNGGRFEREARAAARLADVGWWQRQPLAPTVHPDQPGSVALLQP